MWVRNFVLNRLQNKIIESIFRSWCKYWDFDSLNRKLPVVLKPTLALSTALQHYQNDFLIGKEFVDIYLNVTTNELCRTFKVYADNTTGFQLGSGDYQISGYAKFYSATGTLDYKVSGISGWGLSAFKIIRIST